MDEQVSSKEIHETVGNGLTEQHDNSHSNDNRKLRDSQRSKNGVNLVFKDVCVTMGKKDILKNVYGMAKVGQMLAVMGPSGAGKSTLLNTLSGRITAKSGSVTLNDQPVNRHMRRKISYVLQQDVFYPTLTLNETLTFQTLLRLPDSMPRELKIAKMMEIVNALELNKCFNTMVGGIFVPGLSGGEKKRASIACELLTNPKILLLDEPTSGLDSAIAFSLMSSLDKYAKEMNKTVVTTIHQPSSQIFHMFTNILLINEGQVAYFGAGSKIIDFFGGLGMVCEPHYNPADFILEQLKKSEQNVQALVAASQQLRFTYDWPIELKMSDEVHIVVDSSTNYEDNEIKVFSNNREITERKTRGNIDMDSKGLNRNDIDGPKAIAVDMYIEPEATWQTGFWTQYTTLTKRNYLHHKERYLSKITYGQILFMACYIGVLWFRTARTEETSRDRLGVILLNTILFGMILALDSVSAFIDDTGVFMRERSAGLYRLSAYYWAVMTTEIPSAILLPTMYIIINYWMSNLNQDATSFFCHWLTLILNIFTAQSVGMLVGVLIPFRPVAMTVTMTFVISTLLAGGYYNMHIAGWFHWIKYLSFLAYSLNILAYLEFRTGDLFECDPSSTNYPAQCNGNNTMIDGALFLEDWDLTYAPLYANIIALFIMIGVLRVTTYLVIRFLRRPGT